MNDRSTKRGRDTEVNIIKKECRQTSTNDPSRHLQPSYYHLAQKDLAVLGQLDVSSATDQHLDGSLGTEVGSDNFHQTDSAIDVELKSLTTTGDLRVGVNK